jgi:hypothetical protein
VLQIFSDGTHFGRQVRPGAIVGNIDNDAEMKLVGNPDQNKLASSAVFLRGFHCC